MNVIFDEKTKHTPAVFSQHSAIAICTKQATFLKILNFQTAVLFCFVFLKEQGQYR